MILVQSIATANTWKTARIPTGKRLFLGLSIPETTGRWKADAFMKHARIKQQRLVIEVKITDLTFRGEVANLTWFHNLSE
mmetsp:Transcript_24127/g.44860  ORF Transcript_24127/g.44860 Transcript_24127/m.44860 type:complete len:80 (-) Transcript_24127:11-250(-)